MAVYEVNPLQDRTKMGISTMALYNLDSGPPRPMKVAGRLGHHRREFKVLIDSGSSHNFIDKELVARLGLEIEYSHTFKVRVASGKGVEGEGVCRNLEVSIHGVKMKLDFFVLPLVAMDVVLGVQWLETLGDVVWNLREHRLEFDWAGQKVILRGQKPRENKLVQGDELHKEVGKEDKLLVIQVLDSDPKEGKVREESMRMNAAQNKEIQTLLGEFREVFQDPKGLPPRRDHDHRILLKGTGNQSQ